MTSQTLRHEPLLLVSRAPLVSCANRLDLHDYAASRSNTFSLCQRSWVRSLGELLWKGKHLPIALVVGLAVLEFPCEPRAHQKPMGLRALGLIRDPRCQPQQL